MLAAPFRNLYRAGDGRTGGARAEARDLFAAPADRSRDPSGACAREGADRLPARISQERSAARAARVVEGAQAAGLQGRARALLARPEARSHAQPDPALRPGPGAGG